MHVLRGGVLVLVLTGLLSGCAHRQSYPEHEWVRAAPRDLFVDAFRVSPAHVHAVAASKVSEAVRRLETVPAVAIPEGEAVELVGSPLEGGSRYVLMRGLCVGCGTGRFSVYAADGRVAVNHLSLAPRGTPPTAWPVVVQMADVPAEVYVQTRAVE